MDDRDLGSPGDDAVGRERVDDRALLAAHVAGDPEAFATLVARHRDRLWAVALRTTGDREDAADGLQDGLVAAYRRAASYRGDAAVTTWLHRVVVNACLDRLRAGRVRRAEPLPTGEDADRLREDGALAASRRPASPEAHAERTEQRDRVLAALATLPAEQRAALVLVDMEGYAVAEAAEVLDCAPGTVKSRCSRGRRRLAELLADLVDTGADVHPRRNRAGPPAVPSPGSAAPPGRAPSGPPSSPAPSEEGSP